MTTRPIKAAEPEPIRNLWHASFGLLILLLSILQVERRTVLLILAILTLVYGILDWYRFRNARWNEWVVSSTPLRLILRHEEREHMTSSFWLLLGALLASALFSRQVASLALLYTAWCDPAASFVGRYFQSKDIVKDKVRKGSLNKKSWAGCTAAALLGSLISLVFLVCTANNFESVSAYVLRIFSTSLLGGVIASLAEAVPLFNLNDNLTMPLVAGTLLSLFTPITSLYTHEI